MAKKNRTCFTCQTPYAYCPNCDRDYKKEPWHVMFHNENCKTIFETLVGFSCGAKTKEEAASILRTCDLSQRNTFHPNVQKDIAAVLQETDAKSIGTPSAE